jgi:hypothetical protein
MPFRSRPYLASLDANKLRSLNSIGYHPETYDELHIPHIDRYSGTYVLGVQGTGKSGLLQNNITADMQSGHAVIVIDPHGDLTLACLNHVPPERIPHTFLLDMEDESYPFGVNVFTTSKLKSSLERSQAVERIMHIFNELWPEVATQQYLPMFLPNIVQVFLDNPGKTLFDTIQFLRDDTFRANMLAQVTDPTVRDFWDYEYNRRSDTERRQRAQPLMNRLLTLFTGHSLVRNILGQPRTTINFRKAIEAKQIIFIKLPTNIDHAARLIGTILLAQIHAALFSFANIPEDKRPGVSLYMDEFQKFATSDIENLFSEGRKFGMRLTVAHQRRDQLPGFLQRATKSARSTVCFRLTDEDGREMAHVFPTSETTIRPEDMTEHPSRELLMRTPEVEGVQAFVELYLRPLQGHKRGAGRVEIDMRGSAPSLYELSRGERSDNPRVADPTPYLDALLYQIMTKRNPDLDIPPEIVRGFANCGGGFFKVARKLHHGSKQLTPQVTYPPGLVCQRADSYEPTRPPEGQTERMYYFICCLRLVMQYLARNPIGKESTTSVTDVGRMLTQLPKRAAFVRSGDDVGVIYTHDTASPLDRRELFERAKYILEHTREVYCHPRAEVERLFLQNTGNAGNFVNAQVQPVSRWEEVE